MELNTLFKNETDVVIDKRLIEKLVRFRSKYLMLTTRQVNHPAFYGGHYIGTYAVRFFEDHRRELLTGIMGLDPLLAKRELLKVEGIEPKHRVPSDLMNQALVWLAAQIEQSDLSEELSKEGMVCCFQIMHYRFLGSLSQHYFKYPGREDIDAAAYASLSKKFFLKQEGSWGGVIERRSNDIIGKNSIHRNVFAKYDSVKGVVDCINDVQSRIREQWKGIYAAYLTAKEEGNRISTSASAVEIDGENVFLDRTRYQEAYLRYARKTVADRTSFVKDGLVEAVVKEFPRLPKDPMVDVLNYLSENYLSRRKNIDELVDTVIIHMFDYVGSDKSKARNIRDIPSVIYQLKGVYNAPKGKNPMLLEMRQEFGKIAKDVTKIKTEAAIASIRTGVMLYIVLRTLAKDHYTE